MERGRAIDTNATKEWTKHVAEKIHIANSRRPNAEGVAGDSHHLCGSEELRNEKSAEPNPALCTTDSPANLRPGEPSSLPHLAKDGEHDVHPTGGMASAATLGVTTLRVDDGTSFIYYVKKTA